MTLEEYLASRRGLVDAALEQVVPSERTYPETIHRAMRHSLFAGGKRIRPILSIAASEAVGVDIAGPQVTGPLVAGAERSACALELVHTYSLIHDDLPALDNDDYRRGRPTCHKVFGDAMAILAGDALLTLAFRVLAELPDVPSERRVRMIVELASAAGSVDGMIGGQVADIEAEGKKIDTTYLDYIHRSKTGALLRASVHIGAIHGGANPEQFAALSEYGFHIGLAFQIVDDILDVVGSTESLGKTAGKDAAQQKATFPALYGLEPSRAKADEHLTKAVEALLPLGDNAARLREIAERIVNRSA
ncbi:MAG: polyprenyl synthetase family protein [Acidobacteria bacterium]|nr:polyprenyl synthetase family protein [Acidobacteriota bacterium]